MIGIILAGGRSRRMGRDKTLMQLGADPVLERLYRELAAVTGRAAVVVRAEQVGAMQARGFEAVPDCVEDCGPMGGLYSALSAFSEEDVLALACDLPFMTAETMRELVISYAAEKGTPLLARTRGADGEWRREPLFAIWPHASLPLFQACLARKEYSLTRLAERARCNYLDLAGARAAALQNVNTPDDLSSAGARFM